MSEKNEEKTIRDYFAAHALQGLMGRDWSHIKEGDKSLLKIWAISAFALADEMMKSRNT